LTSNDTHNTFICACLNIFSNERPSTRRTRRGVRQNPTSVLGAGTRRQNNDTFGERSFLANSPTPPPSRLGMEDVFDAGFLDEVPSTPRVRCISFQSSPDSTPERDVTQLVSSDAQRSPLMAAPSRRITRSRSSNEFDGITERGIMGIRVMPVTLGESFGDAGDDHSAESPVGRRRRKRVVRRVSLQSTPDASPDRSGHSSRSASVEVVNEVRFVPETSRSLRGSNSRRTIVTDDSSVVAEEVPALPVTPSAQPQRCRRSDSHNGARTGQAGSDHRGSVALGEESALIVDLTNTPSVGAEHLQRIAPRYSSAQTVRVAESPISRPSPPPRSNPLSRSTSGQLRISMSGIAALNVRGRVLLSDDEESHNMHTGRPATARATDTCVGRNANIRRTQSALNEDSRATADNANSPRGVGVDTLAGVSPRTRMAIEAALIEDNPATAAGESPPRHGRRATRPQRAVAIRAAELARRNRNLAVSMLGPLPREANNDSWRRPAVVIDFNLASSSDSDSSAGHYSSVAS
uniref:RING-type domain-containing protein n=1 Tax=Ascaris lumbricoides TaxID=6252 RepID=A0A0M3ICJ6_ASCLU